MTATVLAWLGPLLTSLALVLLLIGFGPWTLIFTGAGLTCSGLAILAALTERRHW